MSKEKYWYKILGAIGIVGIVNNWGDPLSQMSAAALTAFWLCQTMILIFTIATIYYYLKEKKEKNKALKKPHS